MTGFFITFEGIDGCGKTTQARLCHDALTSGPFPSAILTRNPGGTEIGSAIRQTLLHPPGTTAMNSVCELLLYLADRAQHAEAVIQPALNQGQIVICDRFSDSTLAYQGAGRKLDPAVIESIDAIARQGITPHLTMLYDADPSALADRLLTRSLKSGQEPSNRLDEETQAFKQAVRQGFLALAQAHPQRIVILNALQPIEALHQQTMALVAQRLQAATLLTQPTVAWAVTP
jgi:dTMP kinase